MKISRRLVAMLLVTLVATLWLALQPASDDDALVAVASPRGAQRVAPSSGSTSIVTSSKSSTDLTRAVAARSAAATAVNINLDDMPSTRELRAERSAWPPLGDEGTTAWEPPLPTPVAAKAVEAPPPPPALQAPPFPYTLVGRFEDTSGAHALLSNATRTISARTGDVIDGQWRVDAVPSGRVELTWVPGGLPQTVAYRAS